MMCNLGWAFVPTASDMDHGPVSPSPECLVVDDEPFVRIALVRVLFGFRVHAVGSVEAAVGIIGRRAGLSAIITDHGLGSAATGVSVLEAARELVPAALRVLITGGELEPLERYLESGLVHRLLPKPISGTELRAALVLAPPFPEDRAVS